jgi:hypothetical protein
MDWSTAAPIIFVIVLALVGIWLFLSGRRLKRKHLAARTAFEEQRGFTGQDSPGEIGSVYRATGEIDAVAVTIESRYFRGDRGIRSETRLRAHPVHPLPEMVVIRREAPSHQVALDTDLAETAAGQAEFDGAFRTLAADEAAARALLTPEFCDRLRALIAPLVGIRSLKASPSEVAVSLGGSLTNGMSPGQVETVNGALDLVVELCRG